MDIFCSSSNFSFHFSSVRLNCYTSILHMLCRVFKLGKKPKEGKSEELKKLVK